jgi:hypothetical protein
LAYHRVLPFQLEDVTATQYFSHQFNANEPVGDIILYINLVVVSGHIDQKSCTSVIVQGFTTSHISPLYIPYLIDDKAHESYAAVIIHNTVILGLATKGRRYIALLGDNTPLPVVGPTCILGEKYLFPAPAVQEDDRNNHAFGTLLSGADLNIPLLSVYI